MPVPFAAPSWLFPGTVEENVRFLTGKVRECALLCFGPEMPELSEDFWASAGPGLRWHVHLPTALRAPDGTWADAWLFGPERFASLCADLYKKCAGLAPWCAVLHFPSLHGCPRHEARERLLRFFREWERQGLDRALLLPENVRGARHEDFADLLSGMSLCFDAAHHLSFVGAVLPAEHVLRDAALFHWSAPCGGDAHRALTALSPEGYAFFGRLASVLPTGRTHCIEVFDSDGFFASCPVLESLLGCRAAGPAADGRSEGRTKLKGMDGHVHNT